MCPSLFVLNLKFCFIIFSVLPLDCYAKFLVRTQIPDLDVSFDSICVIIFLFFISCLLTLVFVTIRVVFEI